MTIYVSDVTAVTAVEPPYIGQFGDSISSFIYFVLCREVVHFWNLHVRTYVCVQKLKKMKVMLTQGALW